MKHLILTKILTTALLTTLPFGKMCASSSNKKDVMTVHAVTKTVSMPDDGISHETLLKGYVQQMLDESLPASKRAAIAKRRSAMAQLTGNDLKIYNKLVPEIKKIAAGEITSTIITIPVSEITGKTTWTPADIGVTHFFDGNGIIPEAQAKIDEKMAYNISNVTNALLADLPYELFWYDKEKGLSFGGPSTSWSSDGTNETATLVGNYTFSFYVAKEYSATNNINTTDLKLGITTSVETAITNAKSIVNANSAKPLLAKLDAYRSAICDMVSYNDEAATSSMDYGNPWQLVWVFDNDPSTNVVCEGYSKAFKYLCDLSSLGSGVECLLVTGYMATSNSGGGNHMWNIMKMDDGRSYLVDVTNCDGSSVGYPDRLFMKAGFSGNYSGMYQENWTNPAVGYQYSNETKSSFPESDLTLSNTPYDAGNVHIFETMDIPYQLDTYKGSTINLIFSRTGLTASKPVTICLPFAYSPKTSDGTFYTLEDVSKVGGMWQATMTEFTGTTLEANTPYLFKPSGTSIDFGGSYTIPSSLVVTNTKKGDWTFQGTYEKKTWDAGSVGNDYGFAATSGKAVGGEAVNAGDFVRAAEGATIDAMRCYLTYTPSGARPLTRGDEELPDRISVVLVSSPGATNIGTINTRTGEFSDNVWFELNGRQHDGKPTQNGIYINSKGQKVLVK